MDIINYLSGIGHGSNELYLVIHAPTHEQSLLEVLFGHFKRENELFSLRIKLQEYWYFYTYILLLCLKSWNGFKTELGYNNLLKFITEYC